MHGFIHQAADTYIDQLQSCRPEILCPQLVHDTPKTEILKNILSDGHRRRDRGGQGDRSPLLGLGDNPPLYAVIGYRKEVPKLAQNCIIF